MEIARLHKGETHLRRDQRLRYEYLGKTDAQTQAMQIKHWVRVANSTVLTLVELGKELSYVIQDKLVDLGKKFTFYLEFMVGKAQSSTDSEHMSEVQLSLIANNLAGHGGLTCLNIFGQRTDNC